MTYIYLLAATTRLFIDCAFYVFFELDQQRKLRVFCVFTFRKITYKKFDAATFVDL